MQTEIAARLDRIRRKATSYVGSAGSPRDQVRRLDRAKRWLRRAQFAAVKVERR